MGYFTECDLVTTEEELYWLDYITDLSKRTFKAFKDEIVKTNTEIKLLIQPIAKDKITLGSYNTQIVTIHTINILTIGVYKGNKNRIKTVYNTMVLNTVIHELFHANQFIQPNIALSTNLLKVEDSVYDITYRFLHINYYKIIEKLDCYIDLDMINKQLTNRNRENYNSIHSQFNYKDYEYITDQKMIDNIVLYLLDIEEYYNQYMKIPPLIIPNIGINFTKPYYYKDIIWLKYNHQYNMENIKIVQNYIAYYTNFVDIIYFKHNKFYHDDTRIIFTIEFDIPCINPIFKIENIDTN